jgi:molybdopterin-binding protein
MRHLSVDSASRQCRRALNERAPLGQLFLTGPKRGPDDQDEDRDDGERQKKLGHGVSMTVSRSFCVILRTSRASALATSTIFVWSPRSDVTDGWSLGPLQSACLLQCVSILPMTLSARNHLKGTIEEIQLGDVLAHITVRVGESVIESVITRRSAEEMALKQGDSVTAVVKATDWKPPRSRSIRLVQAVTAVVTRRAAETPMKTLDGL